MYELIGTSVGNVYTGIVTYADDIILMSTTLSGLQTMVNCCTKFGLENKIKFNSLKTEFIISGTSYKTDPFIYVDQVRIKPKQSLTHLGFHWLNTNRFNNATIEQSHTQHRINELFAVTSALINTGVRFCHPNTIFTLFNSLLLPKLLYGLELCQLNQTSIKKLNSCARATLKSLFDLSKHSLNILEKIANIPSISEIIIQKKLNLIVLLMSNERTK